MTSEHIASLVKNDQRYELRYPDLGLKIQGPYAEWVFEAAAEIIAKLERLRTEGSIEELELMKDFGDEAEISVQIDTKKYEAANRFEVVPQCLVSLGPADYRWVSSVERPVPTNQIGQRLHDMSMTRNDTFTDRNGQREPHFNYVKA